MASQQEGPETGQWQAGRSHGELLTLAGTAVMSLGGLLPWFSVAGQPFRLVDSSGMSLLLLAIAVLGLIYLRGWGRIDMVGAVVLGVVAATYALAQYFRVGQVDAVTVPAVSPGIGIYVGLAGGLLVATGGVLSLFESVRTTAPGPDTVADEFDEPPGPEDLDEAFDEES
ncbi:MAG: hypothetical protein ABEJ08_01325 [Halobacteriaceae archaeon]